ncbi:MAG: HD domain-containing protein [Candidatus Micrarchaeota archaeon]
MDAIIQFLFEAGQLKHVERSGWKTVSAPHESVAEHVYRTCIVGYVLAKEAGLNKEEELLVVKSCLFHDLHEARIGDLHRVAKNYVKVDEKRCEQEQRENLPKEMKEELAECLNLPKKLADLAHDADKIECAIAAKEYVDRGFKVGTWITNTKKVLRTKEGKKLLEEVEKSDSIKWIVECKKKIDEQEK